MSEGVPEHSDAPSGRQGVVIGILIVVLLALAVYFFWRGTGVRDANGRHPAPAAAMSR